MSTPAASLDEALPRSFYARPVLQVARACIGQLLVTDRDGQLTAGRIVEAEAYRGPEDRAAHSYGGRRTARTEAMYGPAGHAYLFLIYGLHWQFNLVTGAPGEPHAVLIRAIEPHTGVDRMRARRGVERAATLGNGPGKLCQALAIDGSAYGWDLTRGRGIWLSAGVRGRVARSTRIGIDYAGDWAERRWRFFDATSAHVSRRAPARG